jgi:YYY domain-containing protein
MANSMREKVKKRRSLRRAGLVILLLVGFILRVWNLDWDEGTHQHPDERYWSIVTSDIDWEDPITYFNSDDSDLNPYSYRDTWVYGTLPLFATKGVAEFLEADFFLSNWVVSMVDSVGINLQEDRLSLSGERYTAKTFNSGYEVQNIGRLLAALIDTGTVLLTYLLGRALFSRSAGLIAAALITFSPLHIQYSHFYGAEPWVTFFGTAAVLLSVLFLKFSRTLDDESVCDRKGVLRALVIGFFCGLAAASKFTGIFVFISPILAFALAVFSKNRIVGVGRPRFFIPLISFATLVSVSGLSAIGTFRVFQPYAFSGFLRLDPNFLADLKYLQAVNEGGDFPWVVQWVDRIPLFYPLKSMFWSGMGPGTSICVLVGIAFVGRKILRHHDFSLLIPVSFILALGGLATQQFNPLNRYYLPIYPVLIVFGGFGIHKLWVGASRRLRAHEPNKILWNCVLLFCGLTIGIAFFWGVGFVNGVYQKTHPRLIATSWIVENIPESSTISRQVWDDAVPIRSGFREGNDYTFIELDLFRTDSFIDPITGLSKPELVLSQLDEVDYIIESSNRLYDSIPRMPAEYPFTTAYYESLFNGQLGFVNVASFENKPSLFGFDLPSWGAEETFSVYDHPTVIIWEKSDEWDIEKARRILNPFASANAPNLSPQEGAANALLLQPSQYRSMQSGETFSERFSSAFFVDSLGWLWWFLWLQISALLALPLVLRLCQSLPDHGYGLSKVCGFLTTGTITWVLASWGFVDFSRFTPILSLLILLVACVWQIRRDSSLIIDFFLREKRTWITVEVVFATVFFTVLMLRFLNPDLWDAFRGGEKPMELAYLTAVGRSEDLPPYDPWFAGGVMNYYYFGWFLLAVPMVALGLRPEFVFQFGLATYVSLAVVGVMAIVVNIVGFSRQRISTKPTINFAAVKLGLLTACIFAIAGTFDGVRRYHEQFREIDKWNVLNHWPVVGDFFEFFGGFIAWVQGSPLPSYDWWGPSRVNSGNFDITEFPFFTFLFGDLHPHLMGMSIFVLLVGLSLAYVFTCYDGGFSRSAVLAATIGLVVAISKMMNTWDTPTLCLIALVALSLGGACYRLESFSLISINQKSESALWLVSGLSIALSSFGSRLGSVTVISILVALIAGVSCIVSGEVRLRMLIFVRHLLIAFISFLILTIPYDQARQTFNLGLERTSWVSPFSDFLSHWGLFFFIAAAFMFVEINRRIEEGDVRKAFRLRLPRGKSASLNLWLFIVYVVISVSFGLSVGWAFALSVFGAVAAVHLLVLEILSSRSIQRISALCFWALGFAILAGPEVFVVSNDVERMNTVFKFWLQCWTLFAVSSALSIQVISEYVRELKVRRRYRQRLPFASFWPASLVLILIIAFIYPVSSIGPRLDARFSKDVKTLNGMSYLSSQPSFARYDGELDAQPSTIRIGEDLELINWFRSSVPGSPTIVEWTGLSYDWNSRISIHTGLPTVLGWSSHQRQQRIDYQDMVSERKLAIQNFYVSQSHAYMTDFLLTYDVSYIVVGVQERRFVSSEALTYLGQHPGISQVFREQFNSIYRVDKSILWELAKTISETS